MKKNQIKKSSALLLLAFMFAQFLQAQENYLEGYILTSIHDTVKGYIDYKNWEKNPDKIRFKRTQEAQPEIYRPLDIVAFGVSDEIFVSAIVESEYSLLVISELIFDSRENLKTDTTFLHTLLKGEKSLYYFKNRAGRENFYIMTDSGYNLLVYRKHLKKVDENKIVVENNKYVGQLLIYLQNCPAISERIKTVSYKTKSLLKLFRSYYTCTSTEASYVVKEEKPKVGFGVLAGISNTSIKFTNTGFEYLANTDYGTSTDFSAGIFLGLVLPRNLGKWSFHSELLFTAYNLNGSYTDFVNEDYYTITDTRLEFSYLNLNLMARFHYPLDNLNWFFGGGISNGFMIQDENFKFEEVKFYNDHRFTSGPALSETKKYEVAYLLGTGIEFHDFSAELRFENGNGVSGKNTPSSSTINFFAIFGYRL